MKTLIKIGLFSVLLMTGIVGVNAQQDFPYDIDMANTTNSDNLNFGEIVKTDAIKQNNGILNKLYGLLGLQGPTYNQGDGKAGYYVKMVFDLILSFVSFISVVLIIYSFYLILFVKQEEGVAKARKILIGVAIALIILGLAWLIVSLVFDIYRTKI